MGRSRLLRSVALLAVATLVAVSCGDDGGGGGGGGGGGEESNIIRFTFAPDPAWDWMKDQGILEAMEQESGFRIIQLATWDEFATFAGGHADVDLDGDLRDAAARGAGHRDRHVRPVQHEQGRPRHGEPRVPDGGGLPGRLQDRVGVRDREHDHLGVADQRDRRPRGRRGLRRHRDRHGRLPDHPEPPPRGRGVRRDPRPDPGDRGHGVGGPDGDVRREGRVAALRRGDRARARGRAQQRVRVAGGMVRREPRRGGVLPRGVGLRDGAVGRATATRSSTRTRSTSRSRTSPRRSS